MGESGREREREMERHRNEREEKLTENRRQTPRIEKMIEEMSKDIRFFMFKMTISRWLSRLGPSYSHSEFKIEKKIILTTTIY